MLVGSGLAALSPVSSTSPVTVTVTVMLLVPLPALPAHRTARPPLPSHLYRQEEEEHL
jgi:hypothetical protein